jgi:hypothetical protein
MDLFFAQHRDTTEFQRKLRNNSPRRQMAQTILSMTMVTSAFGLAAYAIMFPKVSLRPPTLTYITEPAPYRPLEEKTDTRKPARAQSGPTADGHSSALHENVPIFGKRVSSPDTPGSILIPDVKVGIPTDSQLSSADGVIYEGELSRQTAATGHGSAMAVTL